MSLWLRYALNKVLVALSNRVWDPLSPHVEQVRMGAGVSENAFCNFQKPTIQPLLTVVGQLCENRTGFDLFAFFRDSSHKYVCYFSCVQSNATPWTLNTEHQGKCALTFTFAWLIVSSLQRHTKEQEQVLGERSERRPFWTRFLSIQY